MNFYLKFENQKKNDLYLAVYPKENSYYAMKWSIWFKAKCKRKKEWVCDIIVLKKKKTLELWSQVSSSVNEEYCPIFIKYCFW